VLHRAAAPARDFPAAMSDQDALKQAAAERAVAEIEDGMVLGLGSGSTAELAVKALGARVKVGLRVSGIPSSKATATLARRVGVPLTDFAQHSTLDLTFDGADEVARSSLDLVKGRGGALLREKIIAQASKRLIIMVDESKLVDRLGSRMPLPVEVVPFGLQATEAQLRRLDAAPTLRVDGNGKPYVTDNGNHVFDCAVGQMPDPAGLAQALNAIAGVVESGLFIGLTSTVIVAGAKGIEVLGAKR
jgi:ribose 5-phosphate isomerase A